MSSEIDKILNRYNVSQKSYYEDDSLGRYEKNRMQKREPSPASESPTPSRYDRKKTLNDNVFMPITLVSTPARDRERNASNAATSQYI